jgi:hypothetical protein
MPLSDAQRNQILTAARALIGTKYSDIDCSHFVHRAYATAALNYPYRSTDSFDGLVGSYFVEVDSKKDALQAADVLMFSVNIGSVGWRSLSKWFVGTAVDTRDTKTHSGIFMHCPR